MGSPGLLALYECLQVYEEFSASMAEPLLKRIFTNMGFDAYSTSGCHRNGARIADASEQRCRIAGLRSGQRGEASLAHLHQAGPTIVAIDQAKDPPHDRLDRLSRC